MDTEMKTEPVAFCAGCDERYGSPRFPDLLLPRGVWQAISPFGGDEGLLCPACILEALEKKGLRNVPAFWGSGPLVGVSHHPDTPPPSGLRPPQPGAEIPWPADFPEWARRPGEKVLWHRVLTDDERLALTPDGEAWRLAQIGRSYLVAECEHNSAGVICWQTSVRNGCWGLAERDATVALLLGELGDARADVSALREAWRSANGEKLAQVVPGVSQAELIGLLQPFPECHCFHHEEWDGAHDDGCEFEEENERRAARLAELRGEGER